MRIVLCAFDKVLYQAWIEALPGVLPVLESAVHEIAVQTGDITKLAVTAVVSPANSYGYMRGGVDLAYTLRFGIGVEESVRARIATLPGSLLPVGEALAVATGDSIIPYLVSAPTMKTPKHLSGPQPVLAATRAAVRCAMDQGYDSLAFPGMGTGTGGLDLNVAARAMLEGIREGLVG